jgi:hypothetical protein
VELISINVWAPFCFLGVPWRLSIQESTGCSTFLQLKVVLLDPDIGYICIKDSTIIMKYLGSMDSMKIPIGLADDTVTSQRVVGSNPGVVSMSSRIHVP